jgi:hypothetical protein
VRWCASTVMMAWVVVSFDALVSFTGLAFAGAIGWYPHDSLAQQKQSRTSL